MDEINLETETTEIDFLQTFECKVCSTPLFVITYYDQEMADLLFRYPPLKTLSYSNSDETGYFYWFFCKKCERIFRQVTVVKTSKNVQIRSHSRD